MTNYRKRVVGVWYKTPKLFEYKTQFPPFITRISVNVFDVSLFQNASSSLMGLLASITLLMKGLNYFHKISKVTTFANRTLINVILCNSKSLIINVIVALLTLKVNINWYHNKPSQTNECELHVFLTSVNLSCANDTCLLCCRTDAVTACI